MEPEKLTPRIAQHLEAIAAARARGVTWREIATTVGARDARAARRACRRAQLGQEKGRYRCEQKDLPQPSQPKTALRTHPPSASAASTEIGNRPKNTFNFDDHLINK